jgi:hypothetical protein
MNDEDDVVEDVEKVAAWLVWPRGWCGRVDGDHQPGSRCAGLCEEKRGGWRGATSIPLRDHSKAVSQVLLEDTAFRAMGNELQMIVTQSRSIEIRSFSDVFLCVYC